VNRAARHEHVPGEVDAAGLRHLDGAPDEVALDAPRGAAVDHVADHEADELRIRAVHEAAELGPAAGEIDVVLHRDGLVVDGRGHRDRVAGRGETERGADRRERTSHAPVARIRAVHGVHVDRHRIRGYGGG
jgi:hypothetical protein